MCNRIKKVQNSKMCKTNARLLTFSQAKALFTESTSKDHFIIYYRY